MSSERDAAASYAANGFYIHERPVISVDLVARAANGMDELQEGQYDTGLPPCESPWNPGDDPNQLCKIENPQFANQAIREVVGSPDLGRAVAEITGGRRIQAWWVQLLHKPKATGEIKPVVGWHQDRTYWGCWTPESDLFTIWLALSDVGPDSGPMRFVPRSHRWGTLEQSDFYHPEIEEQAAGIPVPSGEEWTEVPAVMRAGGFSIHHNKTYHASGPNLETLPRRSLAIHARTEKSEPVSDKRLTLSQYKGYEIPDLTSFIDDEQLCPVLYRA